MHLNVMLMLAVRKRSCFGASHLVILGVDSYNQVCLLGWTVLKVIFESDILKVIFQCALQCSFR